MKNLTIKFIAIIILLLAIKTDIQSQIYENWVMRYNGSLNVRDEATAITIDPYHDIIVTGLSHSGGGVDYVTLKLDGCGNLIWRGVYDYGVSDFGNDVITDASGNVYVTGESIGNPSQDFATVKYNIWGSQVWERRDGGHWPRLPEGAISIGVDNNGYVYIGGFAGQINAPSSWDYAILKYNASTGGEPVWISYYNGPFNSDDELKKMYVDAAGNTYATGFSIGNGTDYDFTTVKFNTSGYLQWAARYNGQGNYIDGGESIIVDDYGNVYVTGSSYEYEDPQSGDDNGQKTFTTIKYNSSGTFQWVNYYFGSGTEREASGISISLQGNDYVYVTGYAIHANHHKDFVTIKYSSSGTQQWVSVYNNPNENGIDIANDISLDESGNAYVTGLTTKYIYPDYFTDYVTIKYNSSGVQQWLMSYDGPANEDDIPYAIAEDNNKVYVTGGSEGINTNYDYCTIKYSTEWIDPACYFGPGTSMNVEEMNSVTYINKDTIFAAGNSGNILYSYNGGKLWNNIQSSTTKNLNRILFINPQKGFAVGDSGTILYSNDYGKNWTKKQISISENLNNIYINDQNKATIVGSNGKIIRTTNGGVTWINQLSNTSNKLLGVYFTNINNGIAVGENGKILRTTNGGSNWINNSVNNSSNINSVYFINSNEGFASCANGTVLYTSNSGLNWIINSLNINQSLNSIYFVNQNTGYIAGDYGLIFSTTNKGSNWNIQTSNTSNNLKSVTFFDKNTGIAVGSNGKIILTTLGTIYNNDGDNSSQMTLKQNVAENISGEFSLGQNFPNPFNPKTSISFNLPKDCFVTLTVYDLLGREVKSIVNEYRKAGNYNVEFDGSNLASGIYIYKIITENFVDSKKMILVK
jgi:photosystem II stability/assembly factor-like uncharacterized protein